jgi:mannose-1-phosphate guanylyltransferase
MNAVLLAAGEGTRLRPLTLTTPKCLVPINGKPLIDYWLEMLAPCDEIDQIFINVSYLKKQVIDHISNQWQGCSKIILWHEKKLLGTAGTLKTNYNEIKNNDVMVIHADNLSRFSLTDFIASYQNREPHIEASMMLFKTDTPAQCGIVELDDKDTVLTMHEKVVNPPGNLANGAVYIFSPDILEWIINNPISDISNELIPEFFGKIKGWRNDLYHRDIGTTESYDLALLESFDNRSNFPN